jgi:AraC-like DNA-binding protein
MEIYHEYVLQNLGFELGVTSILYQIIMNLLRNPSVNWFRSSHEYKRLPSVHVQKFEEIIQYINEHLHEDLSASRVSQQAMLSYSHFARLFKAMMHIPFTDYLHCVRIQKAEQKLVDSERSISEIAISVGYNDTSYFIKIFKRFKGISPNQYRKIYLQ